MTQRRAKTATTTLTFPILSSTFTISNSQGESGRLHPFTFLSTSSAIQSAPDGYLTIPRFRAPDSRIWPNESQISVTNSSLSNSTALRPTLPTLNPKLRNLKTAKGTREAFECGNRNFGFDRQFQNDVKSRRPFTTKAFADREKQISFKKNLAKNSDEPENTVQVTNIVGESNDNEASAVAAHDHEVTTQRISESLHMDHAGLKQFPILGPNDRHIKLFSLQHNFITRLQNLIVLNNLIVLDLYSNKIERIAGLQAFHSLRVLLLGKNRIRRIEGLESLRRLEILDLHGNQLRYLDNINSLSSLRILNVAGNVIRSIRNFGPSGLTSLTELNLKRNRIKNLNGLEKAPQLRKLLISNNELQSISSLNPLKKLQYLEELLLDSNPLTSISDYTNQVLTLLPSLKEFDKNVVTDRMRAEAKNWQRRLAAQEDEMKRLQEKLRVAAASSREEVIKEARRHWESVRNYVKRNDDGMTELRAESRRRIGESRRAVSEPREIEYGINSKLSKYISRSVANISNTMKPIGAVASHPRNLEENVLKTERTPLNIHLKLGAVSFGRLEQQQQSPRGNSVQSPTSSPKLTKVAIVRPVVRNCQESTGKYLQNPIHAQFGNGHAFTTSEINETFETGATRNNTDNQCLALADENEFEFENEEISFPEAISKLNQNEETELMKESIPTLVTPTPSAIQISEKATVSMRAPLTRSSSCIYPGVVASNNPESSNSSSTASSSNNFTMIKSRDVVSDSVEGWRREDSRINWGRENMKIRSCSVDATIPTSDSETTSTTNTSEAPTPGRRRGSAIINRNIFMRRSKQRVQTAKPGASLLSSPKLSLMRRPVTGMIREREGKPLKRVSSLTRIIGPGAPEVIKKQGSDYLVEIDGKTLNLYGQGSLKHFLSGFPEAVTENVNYVQFHFISYDAIIPYFSRLRQTYGAAEHFHFRANNIMVLGQINAMADLQGITSLHVSEDGNSVTRNPLWEDYAIYRLAHWGLKQINGKEVCSEFRGGKASEESKFFESLGYLALSCLPETTLMPLAKKLHTLQAFCCCSQSNSSDESYRRKVGVNGDAESSDSICTSWDDDPVLLDVIGKEALIYTPAKNEQDEAVLKSSSTEVATKIMNHGFNTIQKLEKLQKFLPDSLQIGVGNILMDFNNIMDDYKIKELKKLKEMSLINKKF